MQITERQWQILKAIKAGKKPSEIEPPLKKGYETEFYEEHKKEYEECKKQGISFCWAPVTD